MLLGASTLAHAQGVTVSAAEDADRLDGAARFSHESASSDPDYHRLGIDGVSADENDNDDLVTVTVADPFRVAEDGSATYTMVLATAPTAAVTVLRIGGGDADLTWSPAVLTFSTTDWGTAQTVTVSAAEDADGLDGTAVFFHDSLSSDLDYERLSLSIDPVTATEDDNDPIGVTGSETTIDVGEGGSATYTVKLDTAPAAAVTVTVARTLGSDPDLTASPTMLTFSTTDWETAQTVTVSATEDADGVDGRTSLQHTSDSSDTEYAGLNIGLFRVFEADDDRGVTVTPTMIDVDEGDSEEYTVKLDTAPAAAVTVTAAEDTEELEVEGTATFAHTSASGDAGLGIDSVEATEVENDPGVRVTVADPLLVEEGGSATYTVELMVQPTETVTVTVTVSEVAGGDGDLTASPATLTFTGGNSGNWDTAQVVTVTAAEDGDGLAGTATFEHASASADTDYQGLVIASVVAAEIDNDSLTVSVAADPASVNEGTAARFTVTVNGGVTSEELTVGFTLSGTATAGDDYTAPGSSVLTFAAGTSSGSLSIATIEDSILDDGETLIVTLSSVSNTVDPVTIGTPNSATATIDDGSPVTLSLSDATVDEGEPAEFTVTMSGRVAREVTVDWATADDTATAPEDYAAAAGSLTFRPDEPLTRTLTVQTSGDARAEGDETFVVRLSNPTDVSGMSLGDDPVGTGTIRDDVEAAARARHDRVNREVLPQLIQAMAASTLSAITGRIDAAILDTPVVATNLMDLSDLDRLLRSSGQALGDDAMSLERFLNGSSFVLPLGGAGGGAPGLTVWGSGDYRELSDGEDSGVDWSGDVLSFHLGADTRLRPDLLVGFSVSRSKGSFDYTDHTDPLTVSGDYESRMTSVHPYVNWSLREGLEVWTTVGYGRGEVEIEEAGLETRLSDTEMKTAAAGLNRELWSQDDLMEGGTTTLRLKGEGLFARVKLEGSDRMNPLTSEVQRVRMLLEASHDRRLASGSSFVPSLEVGLRYDGGDGVTGAGAELGGKLRYHDPAYGLTVEGRARVLVTHRDDYEEWGVGGRVQVDPGGDGRGLSLNVTPTWGELESKHSRLYDQGTADLEADDNEAAVSLDAEIGYGWGTSGGRGLLTPYGGLTLSGADEQRYRLGGRFELGRSFDLSLEGERRETGATADHSLMLRAQMRF